MSNSNPKFASDATNVYRVLKRVGFKGSKNQVVDQLNAYANLRDKKDLFFKEVFSTLGYALQPVKPSDIGPLLSGYNLFLQGAEINAIDFKINAKNVLKIKNENLTSYEDVALSNLKKMGIEAFAVVAISEELKSSKQRLTKLNPIRSLGVFRLTWVTIAALFSNILALASSIFIMVVYDRVLPNSAVESLYALAIGVVLAVLFDSLLRSAKSGIINRATEGADIVVSEEIYNQFVEVSGAKNKKSIGELSTVVRDLEVYRDFMSTATLLSLIDLPFIFIFIYVISLVSGPLYLIPLLAVPVVLLSILIAQPIITKISRVASKTSQTRQSILMEILGGLDPLRASGAFAIMKRKFMQSTIDNMAASNKSKNVAGFNSGFLQAVQQLAQVAIIVYGFHLFTEQKITMGAIIATVILSGKAMAPLARLGQMLSRMGAALVARRNIISFLSEPRSSTTLNSAGLDIRSDFAINISNVTLRLSPNAAPIFSNLDIQIKKGERVAIIGPTGAGKTTLSNLVCGLVSPEVGSIQLNGVDCRMINRSDFFKSVGVVFQEPWLFSGTLRENISMGFENVNDHDILEAVRLSGANINPEQPDETLDSVILSQGKNLSGGQKQSIALSRAVLFDQPLLVMDEPTSAMDQMMEDRLVERLSSYANDKTLLLITHKPNMLKLCDRIIVLDQGRITFNGSKEQYVELVKKNV